MLKNLCLGVAIVLGVAAVANGLFMLVAPMDWYFAVPGVTTTGPFNQHFLRDIGLIYLFLGAAFPDRSSEAAIPHRPVGGVNAVAGRPCAVSLLGSRGRHLRAFGARP